MNVFIIPSWYPSGDDPTCGLFCQNQVLGMAKVDPSLNFGISLWGQKEDANLIWANQPIRNFKKLLYFSKKKSFQRKTASNVVEYYTPALTWTRKVLSGNVAGIFKANENNFEEFQKRFEGVDLIHAHVAYPGGYIAMMLSQKYSVPFIITEHLDPFPTKVFTNRNGNIAEVVLKPLKKANQVIVENNHFVAKLRKIGISRLSNIPNMIDESFFIPKEKAKSEHLTFLFIGSMIERKGVKVLLDAIKITGNNNLRFVLCGVGDKLLEYQNHATALGISSLITWKGYLEKEQILYEFQQCDVGILPSISENLGMVLIEAIACGKPVIATKCGGPEVIVNEKNGLLANPDDASDLAEKIDDMAKNYGKFNPNTIREDFLQRFSQPVITSRITEVYEKIIQDNGL